MCQNRGLCLSKQDSKPFALLFYRSLNFESKTKAVEQKVASAKPPPFPLNSQWFGQKMKEMKEYETVLNTKDVFDFVVVQISQIKSSLE